MCGHIACVHVCVCICESEQVRDYVCVLIVRVVSLQVKKTSYWTTRVMGTCSLRVSIGHLFTHPHYTHTHTLTHTDTHKHQWLQCDMVLLPVALSPSINIPL